MKENLLRQITPITEKVPKRNDFWGSTFLERIHYLAITPNIIIELVNPKSGKKFKRKQVADDEVFYYNGIRADLSLKYCYSKNRRVFEKMIKVAEARNPINEIIHKDKL